MLSLITTSRNDFHGGNILKRMRLFVQGLLEQTRRHGLDAELIIVEWNPPADRERLGDILPQPGPEDRLRIRYIVVPAAVHARYKRGDAIPLYQMIAKNVGIRRAKGDYLLCTNVDLLFSDALMRAMQPADLDPRACYRANRCDVPDGIDPAWPIDQQLAWCSQHIIRRNGFLRDFPHANWQQLGWQEKPRWVLWYSDWFARRARAKQEYADRTYYLLDKEACGDFTLLHRDAWHAIQGHVELDMYSIHIDTLAIAAAAALGYRQEILPAEACTYHIDHPQGWSAMSGVEKIKFSDQRPGLGTDVVYEAATQAIRAGKPYDLNPPDWGLADEDLPEYSFHPHPRTQV
jgi:hypothetical protein